jgi:alpha-galactosidase
MTPTPDAMNCRPSSSVPLFLAALLVASLARGVAPTPDELSEARRWAAAQFQGRQGTSTSQPGHPNRPRAPRGTAAPFSFNYDGRSSDEPLKEWPLQRSSRERGPSQTEHTLTWTDAKTGLQVRCVAVEYHDFPTIEWALYFKNTGTNDTPILSDIQSLHVQLRRESGDGFILHHQTGDNCTADSYEPRQTTLGFNSKQRFAPAGGRPTTGAFPYFNVEYDGGGTIAVIGWPGQWGVEFACDQARTLDVRGGQELTRFRLHPGEEARSPLSVLLFWKGDQIRSQNLWRHWMIAHALPRPGGQLVPTHYAGCFGNLQPRAGEEIAQIDGWLKEGIKLDYWFIDAGWYPGRGTWSNVGTWEVDAARFPRGLREVADHCHAKGIKFIVWFEPERVTAGSWLAEQHPEWILGGKKGGLLNLGNPEAWKWTLERVDDLLTSQGIDVYRQDFNIDPLSYWRANDSPDRQGLTEIHHVTGYLAFWDELLRRHPALYIDTCASGGRRNDLETLRRAVPLLRSDYPVTDFTPRCATGQQSQTWGISLWIPYHGTGAPFSDPYTMRSCFAPAFRLGWDTSNQGIDHALLRKTVDDFRQVEKCLLGDFYPLTPYGLGEDMWLAWQFDSPESGEGMVQVFRRTNSPCEAGRFKLNGLNPSAHYRVTDLDTSVPIVIAGQELTKNGLQVSLPQKRSSAILVYQRLK